jgi:hypothetical protein
MTVQEKLRKKQLFHDFIFVVFPTLLTVLLGPVVVTLARQFIKLGGA